MFTLNCKGRLYTFQQPAVMGIINTTPDSFFEDSRKTAVEAVLQQAEKMLADGAAMLDLGGQSTRPGSQRVDADTERQRVLPAIEAIQKRFPEAFISIDTYHALVAKDAVEAGALLVNDVSAGTMDSNLISTVAGLNVPYVLMHLRGTLDTMQNEAHYENVVTDVFDFFSIKLKELHACGLNDIILDPGFGFAKTASHNFQLLKHLSYFQHFQKPMLIGLSRKATIYKTLGITAADALNGTAILNTIALINAAGILRVHDVKEAVEAVKLLSAYTQAQTF